MQQLTGLDASFLALETATTTGHVGGLCLLDPSGAAKPLTLARLTEVLAERLPLVPVLRRKLLQVPLGLDQPYWIRRPADRTSQQAARQAAGPQPSAVGDLPDHRAGPQARRGLHQDPPRGHRRGVRRRIAHRPARSGSGGPGPARRRALYARQAAGPADAGRAGGREAGLAPGPDGAPHQLTCPGPAHPGSSGEHAGRRHARAEPR
jgi:hypothetical protein